MNSTTNDYQYFLLYLTSPKKSYNPFELLSEPSKSLPASDHNPFGFSEELYPLEKDVQYVLQKQL